MRTQVRLRLLGAALWLIVADRVSGADPSRQPVLRAPWAGRAVVHQGNHGLISHNGCGKRLLDARNCGWDNTFALDVLLPPRTPILAPADGTVRFVHDDRCGLSGRELTIAHVGPTGERFETVFAHLSEILVAPGARVEQGQIIALSGASSQCLEQGTSPHLHFHLWSGTDGSGAHTTPIERLVLKAVGVDSDYREYDGRRGDLDDARTAGRVFESDNALPAVLVAKDAGGG